MGGWDQLCRFGYALKGLPPVLQMTSSLWNQDFCHCWYVIRWCGGLQILIDYIRGSLILTMQPFPDKHYSILIMDNCSIHHVAEVNNFIQDAGILLIFFLPPYSPDYNPIEPEDLIQFKMQRMDQWQWLWQVTGHWYMMYDMQFILHKWLWYLLVCIIIWYVIVCPTSGMIMSSLFKIF